MQENHLFEYAVIRVVPRVEREEFLNVGVILYSRKEEFLQTLFHLDKTKLNTFSDKLDVVEIENHLLAFERICNGGPDSGPIGQLDMASRFRWLTATRSTVVQTSKVHPGFCDKPSEAIQKLFSQLVL
ncbi:MAG TPA: DUF3037 domain-containing protein [Chitinophagaceae bacterium]|nr:DUF3037 domain-containing protein [Chitinophagaceae bacterium]